MTWIIVWIKRNSKMQKLLKFDHCALSCDALNVCINLIQQTLRSIEMLDIVSYLLKLNIEMLDTHEIEFIKISMKYNSMRNDRISIIFVSLNSLNSYYNLRHWKFTRYVIIINWTTIAIFVTMRLQNLRLDDCRVEHFINKESFNKFTCSICVLFASKKVIFLKNYSSVLYLL